jgi:hypothetical protein
MTTSGAFGQWEFKELPQDTFQSLLSVAAKTTVVEYVKEEEYDPCRPAIGNSYAVSAYGSGINMRQVNIMYAPWASLKAHKRPMNEQSIQDLLDHWNSWDVELYDGSVTLMIFSEHDAQWNIMQPDGKIRKARGKNEFLDYYYRHLAFGDVYIVARHNKKNMYIDINDEIMNHFYAKCKK